jgi:hypothetical protein
LGLLSNGCGAASDSETPITVKETPFLLSLTDTQSFYSMSELSFGKLIVPALLTTGAVFTALSAPVVMFAETPLTITQGKSSLYSGTVREAALPYLMLAAATSVGLGISSVAVAGWRKSARRADQLNATINDQQQVRVERQAHLTATLGSEAYLAKTGLDFFLEDGDLRPFAPEALSALQALPVPRSRILNEPPRAQWAESADTGNAMAAQLAWLDGFDAPPMAAVSRLTVPQLPLTTVPQSAPLTAAQGFYGFNRSQSGQTAPHQVTVQDEMTIARIQSLQTQLQAIVTQIESLQANLPPVAIQVEVGAAQSGLVQQEFKPQAVSYRVAS